MEYVAGAMAVVMMGSLALLVGSMSVWLALGFWRDAVRGWRDRGR